MNYDEFIKELIKKIYNIYPFSEVKYGDDTQYYDFIQGYIEIKFYYMGTPLRLKRYIDRRDIENSRVNREGLLAAAIVDITNAITNVLLKGVKNEF